ncbi:MAG TPA: response regulator, partial [Rubrivivax sp.]|nr:response regulator [Rubrivivax sp.]
MEDDAVDRMAIERALAASQQRIELSAVVDAEAALAALQERSFDCVLLDYNLPRGSGLTVLQALRERADETPVIAMTGHGDEDLVVELMKAGASDYIAKQALSPDRLGQSIRSALLLREARGSMRQSQRALKEQLEFAELLVGIVSHDLRNPLQAISMSVALLERRGDLPAESLKAVGRIKSSSQRAVRLIR